MAQSHVRRLVNKTQFAPHQYAVGVETFPRLNLDHISRQLRLVELGAERGAAEDPPATERGFDDVEDRVIDYVRNKQAEAQAAFEEQRQTYNQRLAKLGFHSVVGEIDEAAKSASAEIEAEAEKARDLAGELRRDVAAAEAEWTAFRSAHGLDRRARYPEGLGAWVLRIGVLCAIVLIEALMNGYFLGQGNDLGLIGGWFEAGMIALVNVAMGLMAGLFPARWVSHRSPGRKGFGWLLLAVWFGLAVLFNLWVAHYRAALEGLAERPDAVASQTFMADMLAISGGHGLMLLAIGLFFSLIALLDGWSMDDRYPGYGAVDRRLRDAKQAYMDSRAELLDETGTIYDRGLEEVAARTAAIGKRRDESETIRAGLEALKMSYEAHLQYLEDSANGLIEIYRDANRRARPPKTTPASFRKRWKRDFPPTPAGTAAAFSDAALAELIKKGEERKRQGERRLEKARAAAAASFPPLGDA